jgi:hypothetical protein
MPRYNPSICLTEELRENLIDFATERRNVQFKYDDNKCNWYRDMELSKYHLSDKYFNRAKRLQTKLKSIDIKARKTRIELIHRENDEFIRQMNLRYDT